MNEKVRIPVRINTVVQRVDEWVLAMLVTPEDDDQGNTAGDEIVFAAIPVLAADNYPRLYESFLAYIGEAGKILMGEMGLVEVNNAPSTTGKRTKAGAPRLRPPK